MADREKVLKGLECHADWHVNCQGNCPYDNDDSCHLSLCRDALELLKEHPEQRHGYWIIHGEPPIMIKTCSECGVRIFHHPGSELERFCAWCGAKTDGKVKQDE